jgi:hypothetical protein
MEELEARQLLSSVTVLPPNYFTVGNSWTYNNTVSIVGGPVAKSVWNLHVTGSKVWSGHLSKLIVSTMNTSGGGVTHNIYQYLGPTAIMETGGLFPANGQTMTVHGTKVWSPEPRKLNTTDKNTLIGSGQYDNRMANGQLVNVATDKTWVSYLGKGKLTLKVNGANKSLSVVKVRVLHTFTSTTSNGRITKNDATVWYSPSIGRVKVQQTDYVNNVKTSSSVTTLASYKVS